MQMIFQIKERNILLNQFIPIKIPKALPRETVREPAGHPPYVQSEARL